jgi:hypothetical protein
MREIDRRPSSINRDRREAGPLTVERWKKGRRYSSDKSNRWKTVF